MTITPKIARIRWWWRAGNKTYGDCCSWSSSNALTLWRAAGRL